MNRERVERLEASGRVRPAGRAQVEHAKTDGRWAAAYGRQSEMPPDLELLAALDANAAARTRFDDLDAANRFAILFRIQQADTPEKRAARFADMVAMLAKGETIHPRKAKRSRADGR